MSLTNGVRAFHTGRIANDTEWRFQTATHPAIMALLQVSRSRTGQCEISGHCTDVTHVILLIILCSEGTHSHMQAPLISFAEQPIVEQYLKICFRQGIRESFLNPCEFFLHSVIGIPIKASCN